MQLLLSRLFKLFLFSSLVMTGSAMAQDFDPAQAYQANCFACHATGVAHSPEVGDVIEWEIRLEKGFDTLVQSTINGLNGVMPPRGLCTDCSDEELKAIVEYMLAESQ